VSYILDALRKSEHERQIAAGSGAGMLHPAMIDNYRKKGLKAPLLAGSALVVALSGALGWAFWPRSPLPPAARDAALTVERAPVAAPVNVTAPAPVPAPAPTRKASAGSAAAVVAATKPASEPPAKKNAAPLSASAPVATPGRVATRPSEDVGEAPKGLPKISVSGYIDDEGSRLAIINDRLVREGEEIEPGLRLEKIVGETAYFNYKGQRFHR